VNHIENGTDPVVSDEVFFVQCTTFFENT